MKAGDDTPPSRPAATPVQPRTSEDVDEDIYRGEPPAPSSPVTQRTRRTSVSSHSSDSSSSFAGGRLGAIANVVEQAISRWAKGNSSDSSSSSSSQSSISTVTTATRSRRRKSRTRIGNLRTTSEADIHARISIIKAREESRQIPRLFGLYLPPSLLPKAATEAASSSEPILWTSSLPAIITKLEGALRTFSKARRNIDRRQATQAAASSVQSQPKLAIPDFLKAPSRAASFTDLAQATATLPKAKKGKERDVPVVPVPRVQLSLPKPWFLDVASPSWQDMHAIGKILHLHPLTLEDILQQDPREKLELFPKLGYYFIAFRAIVSQRSLKGNIFQGDHDVEDVAEANVYMVVFMEGICVFHFTDISAHTNRVRNRILSLENQMRISSDWLAHIILDSIVDSFFPWLEEIEKEVLAIEDVVFSGMKESESAEMQPIKSHSESATSEDTVVDSEKDPSPEPATLKLSEKNVALLEKRTTKTQFTKGRLPLRLLLRRMRRFAIRHWRTAQSIIERESPPSATHLTLRRMARTRRLVTSLARLLASKSEVVTQVQKRLLTSKRSGWGKDQTEDLEVAIYLGDVQDHILTLQNSLQHFERMLSQSHPTYLSHLRTGVSLTKGNTDRAILFLTVVSIGALSGQCLLGMFSMNVNVPHNLHADVAPPDYNGPFNNFTVFGCVLAGVAVVLTCYLYLVRWWWLEAKRRRAAQLR